MLAEHTLDRPNVMPRLGSRTYQLLQPTGCPTGRTEAPIAKVGRERNPLSENVQRGERAPGETRRAAGHRGDAVRTVSGGRTDGDPEQPCVDDGKNGTRANVGTGVGSLSKASVLARPSAPRAFPRRNEDTGPTRNLYAIIREALIITAENWKRLKCPSACERINKLWYILSFPIKRKQSRERRNGDEAHVYSGP